MTDPLTGDQRQRLAVLYDTSRALHVGEIDVWDLIRAAHWVWNGEDMPNATVKGTTESLSLDEAMWRVGSE